MNIDNSGRKVTLNANQWYDAYGTIYSRNIDGVITRGEKLAGKARQAYRNKVVEVATRLNSNE